MSGTRVGINVPAELEERIRRLQEGWNIELGLYLPLDQALDRLLRAGIDAAEAELRYQKETELARDGSDIPF